MWLGAAESTSHSQLGGRGACSPDAELANSRQRRDNSPYEIVLLMFSSLQPLRSRLQGLPFSSPSVKPQIYTAA